MQQLLKTLALPALCLTALPALAETTGIVAVPAFDQLVAITLPEGFVPAYAAQNDEAMLWEAIPRGETVENWTEMITISGVKPQQELSASDFARYLARSYLNACPPTYSDTDFGPTAVPGGADAFAKWVSCGQVVGAPVERSEDMVVIAIKGDAMYSVQWARRGPASAERLAPDSAALASRLEALMTGLRLCPVVPGEAEPYPSCTGG